MSDTSFWNSAWMETQQNYWQTWSDMSQKAMGLRKPAATPWESALDHWWQAVSPAAPSASRDFMGKMLDQGKAFFRMAEQLTGNLGQTRDASDWSAALEKTFADMQQAFSGGSQQGDDGLHKMMAFWEMPFDNWQRMVSSLSLTPGDALRNMPHDQINEHFNRFLSAPGLGYTREEQGQYQELTRRGVEYQKVLQDYMQFFSNLGIKSVERMRNKLGQLGEEKVVDSARSLYDLWVSSCEEVYAEQAMTPEYAQLYGKLINALMALKQRMAVMVDESLGAMNMPTRSELRTLQERLQETRRENKALRRDLDGLKGQVATLDLRTGAAASKKKAPVRRKTAVKKAATRKTTTNRG